MTESLLLKGKYWLIQLAQKIKTSFENIKRGEESLNVVLWWWGLVSYLICYFGITKLLRASNIKFLNLTIATLVVIYYVWHAFAIRRCGPKKPKLTPEEKALLVEERKKQRFKSFFRKLFLKEPLSRWDSPFIFVVMDIYIIALYVNYILK